MLITVGMLMVVEGVISVNDGQSDDKLARSQIADRIQTNFADLHSHFQIETQSK